MSATGIPRAIRGYPASDHVPPGGVVLAQTAPVYFDYLSVAREGRLTPDQVAALEAVERHEFPDDQMMFELHMLRVIEQIRTGHLKLEDVLSATR
jgi:hypothetical protein